MKHDIPKAALTEREREILVLGLSYIRDRIVANDPGVRSANLFIEELELIYLKIHGAKDELIAQMNAACAAQHALAKAKRATYN